MSHRDERRTGSLLEWRYSERMEVVASNGSDLHKRMAGPNTDTAPRSDYLRDTGELLPYDQPDREIAPGVRVARSAAGGLTIRNGRLREILAEADMDALTKLRGPDPQDHDQ